MARAWARQAGARAHRADAKPALRLKKSLERRVETWCPMKASSARESEIDREMRARDT